MKPQRLFLLLPLAILAGLGWLALLTVAPEQVDLPLPDPNWTPEQLVERQLQALRASPDDPDRMIECFAYASPTNRAATGPVERFALMASQPPYDSLMYGGNLRIGAAEAEGEIARLIVTVIGSQGGDVRYEFLLRRYNEPPYQGCWMTDSVVPLPNDVPQADQADSAAPPAES